VKEHGRCPALGHPLTFSEYPRLDGFVGVTRSAAVDARDVLVRSRGETDGSDDTAASGSGAGNDSDDDGATRYATAPAEDAQGEWSETKRMR